MKNLVFLFDGQGAFRPGVGKGLYSSYSKAKDIVDKSSEILGYDLTDYLWGGKANETSSKTSIAQPSISAISLAYAEVLKDYGLLPSVSLGHSLGEVSAIVYCGVVSFDDGIKIIQKRGEVMERGGKQGGMLALINLDLMFVEEICHSVSQEISEPVVVANINAPNQIVVSGSKEGIKRVTQFAAKKGGRGIPLKVGGAWHSPYLRDAAEEFSVFLDAIQFGKPTTQFYSVVEQKILHDPEAIKDSLKRQMLGKVNWVTAIENLRASGHDTFLEIGPSKILKDLVQKINPNAKAESAALFNNLEKLSQTF